MGQDGLEPDVLTARQYKTVPVVLFRFSFTKRSVIFLLKFHYRAFCCRCKCKHCKDEHFVGARLRMPLLQGNLLQTVDIYFFMN